MGISTITEVEVTPTADSTWRDVNVSSYITPGATGVNLRLEMDDGQGGWLVVRKNGSTDSRTIYGMIGIGVRGDVVIGVDVNGIFEAYVSSSSCHIYLIGQTDSKFVLLTNAINKTPTTNGSYVDVDISSDTGTDTAIFAIIECYLDNYLRLSIRANGSTDDRYQWSQYHFTYQLCVGVDGSELFEIKKQSGVSIYLQGYIKDTETGYTINTNAVDKSLSSTDSYIDIDCGDSITFACFEITHSAESFVARSFDLRKNGTSEGRYKKISGNADSPGVIVGVWAGLDASGICEGKIESTTVDFWLRATFAPPFTNNNFTFTYDINVQTDLTFSYDINVQNDLAFSYDIDAINSLTFSWNLINLPQTLTFSYDINFGNNLAFSYDINFGNDLAFSYDINVQNDLVFSYDVNQQIDFSFSYDINAQNDLTFSYNIGQQCNLIFSYDINFGKDFSFTYHILLNFADIHLAWDVIYEVPVPDPDVESTKAVVPATVLLADDSIGLAYVTGEEVTFTTTRTNFQSKRSVGKSISVPHSIGIVVHPIKKQDT